MTHVLQLVDGNAFQAVSPQVEMLDGAQAAELLANVRSQLIFRENHLVQQARVHPARTPTSEKRARAIELDRRARAAAALNAARRTVNVASIIADQISGEHSANQHGNYAYKQHYSVQLTQCECALRMCFPFGRLFRFTLASR